jgi:hypothetical protein
VLRHPLYGPGIVPRDLLRQLEPFYGNGVALLSGPLIAIALLRRDGRVLGFLAMGVTFIVVGTDARPWSLILDRVEAFQRVPKGHSLPVWSFVASMGAAVGVDALLRLLTQVPRVRTEIVAAAGVLVCAAFFVSLYRFGHDALPEPPRKGVGLNAPAQLDAVPSGAEQPRTAFVRTMQPSLPWRFSRSDVRSYSQPTRQDYDEFMRHVITPLGDVYGSYASYELIGFQPNALDVLSAANVGLAAYTDNPPRLPGFREIRSGPPLTVLRNPKALPRAYALTDYVVHHDRRAALELLGQPDSTRPARSFSTRTPASRHDARAQLPATT